MLITLLAAAIARQHLRRVKLNTGTRTRARAQTMKLGEAPPLPQRLNSDLSIENL